MGKEQVDTNHSGQSTSHIIIKKGKGGHGGGHHGGSWKVAYADFVTAMMAFFLVMWLMASGEKVKEAVQAYFQDPLGFNEKVQAGLLKGSGISIIPGPGEPAPPVEEISAETFEEVQKRLMMQAAEELKENLSKFTNLLEEESINIEVTPEGLLVELIESNKSNFFEIGSSTLAGNTRRILQLVAEQFGQFDNRVRLMGHTDARPYSSRSGYSNWELSADRANSARRVMEAAGLYEGQVLNVTGYADQQLKDKLNPYDVTNRRISILLMNKEQPLGVDTVFVK